MIILKLAEPENEVAQDHDNLKKLKINSITNNASTVSNTFTSNTTQ